MIKPIQTREFQLVGVKPPKIEEKSETITEVPKGHCLVETNVFGICSGDQNYFAGKKDRKKLAKRLPLVQGHEGTATVLACEDGTFDEGDIVAVIPFQACGKCSDCKAGRENYCKNRVMMASNGPGLARTHFTYPSSKLIQLPPGVSPFVGALVEPASIAYRAIQSFKSKRKVAVFGTGAIGFLTAVNLSHFNGLPEDKLYVFGRTPSKLKLVEDFATAVVIDKQSMAQHKASFDFVFEAVGKEESAQGALDLTKEGGTCVVIGIYDGPITLHSDSQTETIENLTEFVNSGGSMEINGKHIETSAFSLTKDYYEIVAAMDDSGYRAQLSKMVNKRRIVPVETAKDLKDAFMLNEREPHIQRVFVSLQ